MLTNGDWVDRRELEQDGQAGKRQPGRTAEKLGRSGAVGPAYTPCMFLGTLKEGLVVASWEGAQVIIARLLKEKWSLEGRKT